MLLHIGLYQSTLEVFSLDSFQGVSEPRVLPKLAKKPNIPVVVNGAFEECF